LLEREGKGKKKLSGKIRKNQEKLVFQFRKGALSSRLGA